MSKSIDFIFSNIRSNLRSNLRFNVWGNHTKVRRVNVLKLARLLWVSIVLGCVSLAGTQPAYAKSSEIYTSWRNNKAVGGYDVISFYQGHPIKGEVKIVTKWMGADWHFSNQANLAEFLKSPKKYVPAYGGYCAWAIANNKLAKGSPKYWIVRDERLFLNFNTKIQALWLKDADALIEKADANWPSILD